MISNLSSEESLISADFIIILSVQWAVCLTATSIYGIASNDEIVHRIEKNRMNGGRLIDVTKAHLAVVRFN